MAAIEASNAVVSDGVSAAFDDPAVVSSSISGYPLQDTLASNLQPLLLPEKHPDSNDVIPGVANCDPLMSCAFAPQEGVFHDHSHFQHPSHPHPDSTTPSAVVDDIGLINAEEKQLCMLCVKRFDMDGERDLFLAHLVMDHNVVIADVKHVPYFPGYVEEWRKMFKTLPLDICPKIKTNYVAKTGGLTVETVVEEAEGEEFESLTVNIDESLSEAERVKAVSESAAADDGIEVRQNQLTPKAYGSGDGEDEAVSSSSPSKQLPEAGDAPAIDVIDVLKRAAARPALEVEDPAIAAAHPALPSELLEGKKRDSNAATSSNSLDSVSSSSSSSYLSTSNAAATMMTAAQGEEYHYLLCDAIPQDYDLRHRLQRKRLEYALQRQEAERNDITFSRLCLFCNAYFEGNRAGLFHHMAEDHNFNVGQPDNIVFSNEFLDTLQNKLDNSICLYCDKDFKDKATLKDHMRKKMHRRIRGSNREYDKFYLINYLELGKSWNDIQGEEDIEIRPGPAAESEWADWTGEGTFSVCLFCTFPSCGAEEIYAHMRVKHGFDLSRIRASLKLSFYQQIKLINFYRRKLHENICPSCSLGFPDKESTVRHMQETKHTNDVPALVQWDQPQFFFPTYENDHLLSLLEDVDDNSEVAVVQPEDPPDSSIYNSILARRELRHEIIYDSGPVGYKGRAWK